MIMASGQSFLSLNHQTIGEEQYEIGEVAI